MNIINVTADNVEDKGFFCKMSQPKNQGYLKKLEWLQDRFKEGMKIKMLDVSEGYRGFIEYIPGEYAWRAVYAKDYLFIHCLWIVGKSKGKGFAKLLLNESIKDAKKAGMKGVAILTSSGNWLINSKLFLSPGFEEVEEYPPFKLLVKKFSDGKIPYLPDDWEKRLKKFGNGITVIKTGQCPYLEDGVKTILDLSKEYNVKSKVLELKSSEEIREKSPSPYGVFGVVYDKKLLSYHWLLPGEFKKKFEAMKK